MTEPTALLTGGNSGIGLHAARALAEAGWQVTLASRDLQASERVCADLHPARVSAESLDLGSLASVRALVERLQGRPLRVVLCNAGVSVTGSRRLTADGFEWNAGINHLGHFALVRGLLPSLEEGARIVVVGSGTARMTEDQKYMKAPRWPGARALLLPEGEDPDMDSRRYPTSKLANALYVLELHRRLEGGTLEAPPGVCAVHYEPGFVPGTGLARDEGGLPAFMFRWVMPVFGRIFGFAHAASDSGRALARLALEPGLTGGRFFGPDGELDVPPAAADLDRARELWEVSEALLDDPP